MKLIKHIKKYRTKSPYIWFVLAILVITYIIPTIVNPTPFGTDTYTHLYHAGRMSSTFSLEEYYDNQRKLGDESFTYPFAIWLFGSTIKKITRLDLIFIGKYIPIIFLIISLIIYYSYSKRFLSHYNVRFLAILFLISVPLTSRVNSFVSSSIALPFLIILLYLLFNYKFTKKTGFLFFIFAFMLTISHVGSLIFFINFLFLYFILESFVNRKINNNLFIGIIMSMTSYYIATFIFNEIRPQYIQKTKMILKIGNLLSKFNLGFLDISKILYENVFKDTQLIYFIFLFGFLYLAAMVSATLGKIIYNFLYKHRRNLILVPLIGKIPKTLAGTPIWVGIPQTLFSIFGLHKVNVEGKVVFLTTFFIVLMSGSDSADITRKIYYLIIIIPILSALGFYTIFEQIQKRKEKLLFPFVLLTFTALLIMPVTLNVYFASKISGELYEKQGLLWLGNQGNPSDAAAGIGMRHLISVYGKKIPGVSTVSVGSELRNYFTLRKLAYFTDDQYSIFDLLASYNIKYYLISKRSFKVGIFNYQMLEIENKSLVDKIYSNNKNRFRIYMVNHIPKIEFVNDKRNVEYVTNPPIILDSGKFYLIRTKNYQVKIDKKMPVVEYFGTRNKNYLKNGYIFDYITWKEVGTKEKKVFGPRKMQFNISISKDSIKYSTKIFDENLSLIFDLYVKYIFMSDTFKQQITVIPHKYGRCRIYTKVWKPLDLIVTQLEDKEYEEREVFPSEDSINKHLKFNKIYLQENSTGMGIFIYQDHSFPYPNYMSYKGSIKYPGYAVFVFRTTIWTYPGYPNQMDRYFTLARNFSEGKDKIGSLADISIYPFPEAIKPMILLNLNENILKEFRITNLYYKAGDSYILGPVVEPPFRNILNYEGYRKIRFASVNNSEKVIFPVCGPYSEKLTSSLKEKYFSEWISQINVLKRYDTDACVFDWGVEQLLSEDYRSNFESLINYSLNRGFTITNPEYISQHYKQLQNVTIYIKNSDQMTTIKVINNNNQVVKGFTLKILNKKYRHADIYAIPNKKIVVKNFQYFKYIYFDLNPREIVFVFLKSNN